MVRGKLILICQVGGEFVTNSDGSLSYGGGDAHALDISSETGFDDLKFKLAETCNFEHNSLCIKYFLPGNKRTLITLANDKDFKRMKDFHEKSVTADIFVTGKEGFDPRSLDLNANRESGIKQAETISAVGASRSAATTTTSKVAPASRKKSRNAKPADSVNAVNETPRSHSRSANTSKKSRAARTASDDGVDVNLTPNGAETTADATDHSPDTIDMSATPADTVKKRRRTASWRFGANGPAIVSVTEDDEESQETTKSTPQRKNSRARWLDSVSKGVEQQIDDESWDDGSDSDSLVPCSSNNSIRKLVASWKKGISGEGQDFKDVQEFRDTLQKYAIARRFGYKMRKNDATRVSGVCVAEGCPWRILASWVPSEKVFRIKRMNKKHTCGGESWKSAHPAKNLLVNIIKDRLKDSPHHKPKEIAKGILQDFGLQLNYSQVWRGIEDAREQLQGSYKEAYNQLPWYCEKIEEANPGSFAKLLIGDEKKFQHLFLSFHATIHGFENGCRPLLFLDAISLKSKYHEMLLTATALDGDDGIFPVAFAIVDIENDDSWRWFLEHLRSAISTSQPITFVSDKDKGLMKSVLEVFENSHHGHSIYYLMDSFIRNLKGPFHGEGRASLPGNLLAAARAVRHDGFKMFTEQIKRVSSIAYDWIMENEPEYWANALFKGELFSQITFDVAESYANWVEEARELPIIQKVEFLRCKVMELISSRQTDSTNWSTKLTPSKEERVKEESFKARYLKVLFSSDTLFEVHDTSINVVDLNKRECSCVTWKATGLPCCHAIAVFNSTGRNPYDYCSRYFTVDCFRTTYSELVNPVSAIINPGVGEEVVSDDEQVLPPGNIRAPPPMKKYKRSKSHDIIRRSVCCTRCKGVGHNKATCKETM
ncbi:hypothetical protein SLE2022_332970 [Rubroshorea leprosula]